MNKVKIVVGLFNLDNKSIQIKKKFDFEYDQNTTFKELLNELNDVEIFTDHVNAIKNIQIDERHSTYIVDYIFRNNEIEWLIPLDECLISEYLDTYALSEINFHEPLEIGTAGFFEVDWNVVFELLKKGLEFTLSAYELTKIIKEIHRHFINYKRGEIPYLKVKRFIRSRDFWSLQEFCFLLDIEERTAELLLYTSGYIFDSNKKLYFYNESLEQKNEEKFIELLKKSKECIDSKKIIDFNKSMNHKK